jgi:ABC-type phosphate transport system substrate-binding protein
MRNLTKVGVSAALALTATLAFGGQAFADPPAGVHPKGNDVVGVGSDATQYVTDALASAYNKTVTGASTPKLFSWDASGSATIVTKAGAPSITRPNGGNAGVAALLADTKNYINFARTTSPKKTDGSQNSLTFYAFARDGVTWASPKSSPSKTPTNLTSAQLKGIFTGVITNWNQISPTLASNPIHPYLPASTFALRTFFESALGISDAQVGANVKTLTEQSNGKLVNGDPLAILPYSISNYIAQTKVVVPNNTGGVTIRSIDGKVPAPSNVLNPNFSPTFLRLVYNVAKKTQVTNNPLIVKIFGKGGYICSQPAIITKYGFGSLGTACGVTS